jgi:phosphoglycolate phosphatase
MVGDRRYDIEAANDVGIKSVGVTYGYGSHEELSNAGATYIADSPQDILSFVV